MEGKLSLEFRLLPPHLGPFLLLKVVFKTKIIPKLEKNLLGDKNQQGKKNAGKTIQFQISLSIFSPSFLLSLFGEGNDLMCVTV